ncbi:MAG: alpha/beta fold hydrolase [Gemmataceae bacterium]|nr:alpha/beta fold hydrolase [Gemmataceae bacterium]
MKRAWLILWFGLGLTPLVLAGCGRDNSPTGGAPRPDKSDPTSAGPKTPRPGEENRGDLLRERKGFTTRIVPNPNYKPDGPVDQPPPKLFRVVRYPSAVGPLAAYLSPDPGDGKKHPAVIYAHGGFGGINGFAWGRESFAPFREAGFVIFCPSWRGENDNPGQYEMFYGELDDALAAIEYLTKIPYVDADRIYMIGHSTGGTVTLLAAEASLRLRAAFSFGGAPDLQHADYGNTPFDRRIEKEVRLRSPIHFVKGLKTPTFYFEGDLSPDGQPEEGYIPDARRMQGIAQAAKAPFTLYIVKGGTHFNIVRPICTLLAGKLRADTGNQFNVSITADEVNQAFSASLRRR